ncbi:beta-ketoacyl synthase chain length factor [Actinokineospora diospyrosa]|uniref:Beta-ketoacyl synthase, N-terminal domain n=1 Tax=Actinokineospora diospyrosa TaxID=103728 RepID=A0ABT1IM39_9PSEU|nr:beta-ketoacyl synthase chain length factor [Actinokineospora diospyrosa]MCP2273735.1 Beta-ketoacyl synthase, N-terminal domain [Actinokineospora diospyrosa]
MTTTTDTALSIVDLSDLSDLDLSTVELEVLAEARWPGADPSAQPAPLPGFVSSSFAPLIAQAADDCLSQVHGSAPAPAERGDRTAVVVVSVRGDLGTSTAVAAAVDAGKRMPPILFFQSVVNSAAGRVAVTWGLRGPVVCTSPVADPVADAVAVADLLIADEAADEVLLVLVEQGAEEARALLLGRAAAPLTGTAPTSTALTGTAPTGTASTGAAPTNEQRSSQ